MIKTRAKTVLVAVRRVVYNRPRPNDNVAKACYVLKIHSSQQRNSVKITFVICRIITFSTVEYAHAGAAPESPRVCF